MEYDPTTPAIVVIDDIEYVVRNNYLHRGLNPRLVIQHKVEGKFVVIQAENNNDLCRTIMDDPDYEKESFKGYWVEKRGYKAIRLKVKNIRYLG